jgi:hypothetical protein
MAYIGNVPAEKYTALTQQTFSTPTGTSFTLSQAVTNSVDIDLYIDNVKQDPTTYSVSGTALTTSTIASPSTMYCIFNGRTIETVNPPDGSVGTAKVTDDAITLAKLAPGTDGNIISYDASGNPVAIATGSSGQVLTSGGAGAAPSFAAASGGVNTPYFEAYIPSDQTLTDAVSTLMNYTSERHDSAGAFNTTSKRFIPQTAGKYYVYFSQSFNAVSTDKFHSVYVYIKLNGSIVTSSYLDNYDNYTLLVYPSSGSAIVTMNGSSDYIELWAYFNVFSGNGKAVSGEYSTFGAYKLIE